MELALVTGRGPDLVTDLEGRRPLLRDQDVVVLGVRERIEIWDRAEFERYRDAHADAYENGDLEPRGARPVAGGHSGFDRGSRTTEG